MATPPAADSFRIVSPPPPRKRPVLWILGILVALGAGGVGVWSYLMASRSALMAYVPADATGVLVLDFPRLLGTKGFQPMLDSIDKYLVKSPTLHRLYRAVDLRKLESVALVVKGTESPSVMVIAKGHFDKKKLEPSLIKELGLKGAKQGPAMVYTKARSMGVALIKDHLLAAGEPGLVEQAVGFALGHGKSADANEKLKTVLRKVNPHSLFFGFLAVPSGLRRLLAPKLGGAAPARLALSLDEKKTQLQLHLALGFDGPQGAKAVQVAVPAAKAAAAALQKLAGVPAKLRNLAQSLAAAAKAVVKDGVVVADATTKLAGDSIPELVSGAAIPAWVHHELERKSAEAAANIEKIFQGAVAYYAKEQTPEPPQGQKMRRRRRRRQEEPLKQFPASVGPTPPGSPCNVPSRMFQPDAKVWDKASWKALDFSVTSPHYYRYTFVSSGAGPEAAFTVRANGDLDCNGEWSSYELTGKVGMDGKVVRGKLKKEHPLE